MFGAGLREPHIDDFGGKYMLHRVSFRGGRGGGGGGGRGGGGGGGGGHSPPLGIFTFPIIQYCKMK